MKISHIVIEQTGWKFYWLDGKIPLWHMQTVFCFRSSSLHKLFFEGGGGGAGGISHIEYGQNLWSRSWNTCRNTFVFLCKL